MVAATQLRVEAGREHLGQHRQRRALSHHPAPEARMAIAHAVRRDHAPKRVVDLRGRLALSRDRRLECRAHLVGERLPDGLLSQCLQVREQVVEHAMAGCA